MMNKMLWLVCLMVSLSVSAAEPTANKFSRLVLVSQSTEQQLMAVTLDEQIYAASDKGFHGLRLVDQNGVETPYLLQQIVERKAVTQHMQIHSITQTLQKSGEEGIEILLSLDKKAEAADGLTIVTSQRDFEYALQIFGSDDEKNWQLLVDNALIYDYSRFMNFRNRDIALPENTFRNFKITIAKPVQSQAGALVLQTQMHEGEEALKYSEQIALHQRPLHIEQIAFWHNETISLPESVQSFDYPIKKFTITQDLKNKTSQVNIDGNLNPLNGFKLKFSTPNFNRRIYLQVPSIRGNLSSMVTIARSRIESLHFEKLNLENTTLHFPEQRQKDYQLIIEDHDNPPLDLESITGIGPSYQLVFLSQPEHEYHLTYGITKSDAPCYEISTIETLLRRGYQSIDVKLGPTVELSNNDESLLSFGFLNSGLFLGIMIAIMVVVLAWSLYRVAVRIK